AVFVRPDLNTMMFVNEGGFLEHKQPGFPNEYAKLGEPWAAWVDAADRGLGIWCPHAREITCYRVRNGNKGDCSYLAPLQTFALSPGLVFEYECALLMGSVDEIRQGFKTLKPQP
ncbi:MAG TPA: hypothetical protein VD994_07960, partial [Prosthecobacter sp.]|nr:hypothetical protein [Prosthecobacter sp.]